MVLVDSNLSNENLAMPARNLHVVVMIALIALSGLIAPHKLWALGADHPAGEIGASSWPQEVTELVNAGNRVHGYFVNFQDVFFLRGDVETLNASLAKLSEARNSKLDVVIHPGKLPVQSPWDEKPRDLDANWRLDTSSLVITDGAPKPGPFGMTLHIYLGDSIPLDDIRIPKGVAVRSGGEIEAFIEAREKADAADDTSAE